MGFRYTERELAKLREDDVYESAVLAARAMDAHILPDRDDFEAIEYLHDLYLNAEEFYVSYMESQENREVPGMEYGITEFEAAESSVPFNDYKCGIVFAQLGLWFDRLQTTLDQDYIEGIRYILYDKGVDAVNNLSRNNFGYMGRLQ